MSKTIVVDLGPKDPNEEDRILRAVVSAAGDGDHVHIRIGSTPKTPEVVEHPEPTRPNEQLAQAVGESIDKALAAAPEATTVGNPLVAAERANKIIATTKSWRQLVNECGWKIVIEATLKTAWEYKAEAWNQVKAELNTMLGSNFF